MQSREKITRPGAWEVGWRPGWVHFGFCSGRLAVEVNNMENGRDPIICGFIKTRKTKVNPPRSPFPESGILRKEECDFAIL